MKVFSWTQEEKEYYYRLAEEKITGAGLQGKIRIDKSRFTLKAGRIVKVYIKALRKIGNKETWSRLKVIDGFEEERKGYNEFGEIETTIFFYGCICICMEG